MKFIYTKAFLRVFITFTAVSLFTIANITGVLNPVKSGTHKVYGGVTSKVSDLKIGIKTTLKAFVLIKRLSHENDLLNQKVDELSFENIRLKAAKQENSALRKALNFAEETNYPVIPATAKIADPTGFTQTVIIDKGQDFSIREGMAVIAPPGLLVGRVTRVYSSTSEVTLLTNPSLTVNAEVAESGAKGLISGEHGLSLKFDLITNNEFIKSGDQLMTSGLAGDFPRGLLIGEINSISSKSSDLFQKAYVQPAADLRNLKFLFVINQ